MSINLKTLDLVNLSDQIQKRCSIRKYKPENIDDDAFKKLQAFVDILNQHTDQIKIHLVRDASAFMAPLFIKIIKNVRGSAVIEVLKGVRPLQDVTIGLFGELFVLKATELGLGTVWVGGDKVVFSSEGAKKTLKTTNPCPFVIPFGISDQQFKRTQRTPTDKLTATWSDNEELLQAMRDAPSALNKQPWTFSLIEKKIFIKPKSKDYPKMFNYVTNWVDCGIAAAHAVVFTKSTQIFIDSEEIKIEL